jgi:hypothetical protein
LSPLTSVHKEAVLHEGNTGPILNMASSKVSSITEGSAVYKKKQGVLAVASDEKFITWTPRDAGSSVRIAVANITSISTIKSIMRSKH